MTARGFIVGAPRSGAGKTSVTIGLMRAFRRRGLRVKGAKSGPDYIDPGFHEAATGRPGVNLDSWAMPPALLDRLAAAQGKDADLVIAESAMGLFDGVRSEPGRLGAAADLARRWGLPVLLVLDVSGQSQSAAAVALGFKTLDRAVQVGGVVLNRVGSERHRRQCADAIEEWTGLPVLGAIARDATLSLPERHLGLVQASEHGALESFIETLADTVERALDLDRILALAAPFSSSMSASQEQEGRSESTRNDLHAIALPPPGQRVAVARDAAFTFLYPHLARAWREAGAELVFFSPLADEPPPEDCDACWLPGGYPELHAGRLAAARGFQEGLRSFTGQKPVHGECGGFMVLGQALQDAEGAWHPMPGLLGHSTSFAQRKMNLGYREARLLADCAIGRHGDLVRGHEFHYARVTDAGADEPLAEIRDATGQGLGPSGARRGNVSGTFFHAIAKA
ncbi:MAG TPA: cobyrinate a,c-diamide synthase [Mesorhizobium sp.]|jgi:cobyrinic acid a,c-diamide synthase|nr:cobyrinate a,c-diamide synthase [Mesorhizobium sp.]